MVEISNKKGNFLTLQLAEGLCPLACNKKGTGWSRKVNNGYLIGLEPMVAISNMVTMNMVTHG